MEATSITVCIPVSDLERSIEWYGRVLERESGISPVQDIYEIEVYPGCWLQLFQGEANAPPNVFRIGVEDIARERQRILALGVAVEKIERIEGVIALGEFQDPDGNRLSLYQVLE